MASQNRAFSHLTSTQLLNGSHAFLGTITATTTKNNSDTAVPFTITEGTCLMIQSDVATYILAGTATTQTVTSANGLRIEANEKYVMWLTAKQLYLACLGVAATATVKIWSMN
jgi:hypothetical protein